MFTDSLLPFHSCCRNLEDFVFSHFPLINLRIHALKMVIEGSRCSGKDKAHFLEDVSNARYKLASELRTLYSARRIQVSLDRASNCIMYVSRYEGQY